MCDVETRQLIEEIRKESAKFKPWSVLDWNGTSWDYVTMALVAPGLTRDEKQLVASFAQKALLSAAIYEIKAKSGLLSLIASVLRPGRKARMIKAMASVDGLPPEPQTYQDPSRGGATIAPVDTHRVRRRRAITATILLRLEKNPEWAATEGELREIMAGAGARIL